MKINIHVSTESKQTKVYEQNSSYNKNFRKIQCLNIFVKYIFQNNEIETNNWYYLKKKQRLF